MEGICGKVYFPGGIQYDGEKRLNWLDSIKGFATITVVIGHIMDGYLSAGLFPNYMGFMTVLLNIVFSFHMPLFFVLSGFSYGYAYLDNERQQLNRNRIKIQTLNTTVLYFVWCILFWAVKMLFAKDVNSTVTIDDLLWIPLKAIPPYWYLYVLVVCYILTSLFITKRLSWKCIFICSFILCLVQFWIEELWIGQFTIIMTISYYFFFFLGLLLSKKSEMMMYIEKCQTIILNLTIGTALGMIFVFMQSNKISWGKVPVFGSVMALTISLGLIGIVRKVSVSCFEFVGRYSLEIYLMHCFITAGNRKILAFIGIDMFALHFIVNLLMAILIPIVFSVLAKKTGIHSMLFKPVTYLEKRIQK